MPKRRRKPNCRRAKAIQTSGGQSLFPEFVRSIRVGPPRVEPGDAAVPGDGPSRPLPKAISPPPDLHDEAALGWSLTKLFHATAETAAASARPLADMKESSLIRAGENELRR